MSEKTDIPALTVAVSPHIRDDETISRIMWTVAVTLVPATFYGVYNFGWYAGAVITAAVVSAVVAEAVWQRLAHKPVTVSDGSAVVTGLLVALVLPPNVPLFVPIVASLVAIIVAKQIFGGLGCNIWNPALVGRAFVQIAYPQYVTLSAWPILKGTGLSRILMDIRKAAPVGANPVDFDAISQASPLAQEALKTFVPDANGTVHMMYGSLKSLFLGAIPGCIGETSAVLLIIGGIYLIYKGYVNWKVPATFLGTILVFAFLIPTWKIAGARWLGGLPPYEFGIGEPSRLFFPLYQVLAGGAVIGAFFMATDMVTTPITSRGQVIFALGCGLITSLVRLVGHGFPEGVCYSILLMNTAAPVIDRYTRPKKYGAVKK
ncbi:MAG: RnfABCDGE type electron transport complex subunit D [Planctomycetota bacterium]|jgi:electron transport complex protein RnfD